MSDQPFTWFDIWCDVVKKRLNYTTTYCTSTRREDSRENSEMEKIIDAEGISCTPAKKIVKVIDTECIIMGEVSK